jgi:hypothetical protein
LGGLAVTRFVLKGDAQRRPHKKQIKLQTPLALWQIQYTLLPLDQIQLARQLA